jgi:outer membrane protein OmpA-like peptidoglycan-associated protein
VLVAFGIVLGATPSARLEAQLLKRVTERVKEKAAERKVQTEEGVLTRAVEPADSVMSKVSTPVESLAAQVGGGAGAAVGRIGRGKASQSEEEARLRLELAAGHADLPAVQFEAGSSAVDPSSQPSLQALAAVINASPGVFLIQGRADLGTAAQEASEVANARAAAVKSWLVGNGVPAERVFAAGDGAAMPEAPLVSVVQMQ